MSLLNESQKEFYHNNGYLIIRDFVKTETCHALIQRASELMNTFDPTQFKTIFSTKDQRHAKQTYFLDSGKAIHFFLEENSLDTQGNLKFAKELCINKMGHALHRLDPIFKEFSYSDRIHALTQALGITEPTILQSMYICKQPLIGGEVTCHQDATYLYDEKHSIMGLWFALEDATIENGCLWAIPGGHRLPLKSRMKRNGSTTHTEIYDHSTWPLEQSIPLEVPRGSVILLHSLLPHMSRENSSPHSRHAYTLHVMPKENTFAPDNWLEPLSEWV